MRETKKPIYLVMCWCALSVLVTGCAKTQQAAGSTNEFEFDAGYPTPEASEALYDEMEDSIEAGSGAYRSPLAPGLVHAPALRWTPRSNAYSAPSTSAIRS